MGAIRQASSSCRQAPRMCEKATCRFFKTYTSNPDEQGASASGGRAGSTSYLLDGSSAIDPYLLLALPLPNPDATQEFTVTTNNFDAQYGFAPAAVVNIVT